jgi:hypothetical protein
MAAEREQIQDQQRDLDWHPGSVAQSRRTSQRPAPRQSGKLISAWKPPCERRELCVQFAAAFRTNLRPPHWAVAAQGTSAVLKTLLRAFADHILVAVGRLRRPRRFWQARLPSMFATLILMAFQIVLLGQGASPLLCFWISPAPGHSTRRRQPMFRRCHLMSPAGRGRWLPRRDNRSPDNARRHI